jgi:hypothetical protein
MLTLHLELANLVVAFALLFSKLVFKHAQVLLVGALLSLGKRTVTSALRSDAALYEAVPQRKCGTMGRPRKKGARLPALKQVSADPPPDSNL